MVALEHRSGVSGRRKRVGIQRRRSVGEHLDEGLSSSMSFRVEGALPRSVKEEERRAEEGGWWPTTKEGWGK